MSIPKFHPDQLTPFGNYSDQPAYSFVRFAHINTLIDELILSATIIPTVDYTTIGGYVGDSLSLNFSYRMNTVTTPDYTIGDVSANAALRPDITLKPINVFPTLTGITFPTVTEANDIRFENMLDLSTITFSDLTYAASVYTIGFNSLSTLNFPVLAISNVTIDEDNNNGSISSIATLNFPHLTSGWFKIVSGTNNTALTSINFPMFAHGDVRLTCGGYINLTTISFPSLLTSGDQIVIEGGPALTTMNFSQLTTANTINISDNPSPTAFIPEIQLNSLTTVNNLQITSWAAHSVNTNELINSNNVHLSYFNTSCTSYSAPNLIRSSILVLSISNNITSLLFNNYDSGEITLYANSTVDNLVTTTIPLFGTHPSVTGTNKLTLTSQGGYIMPAKFRDLSWLSGFTSGIIDYAGGFDNMGTSVTTPASFIGDLRFGTNNAFPGAFSVNNFIGGSIIMVSYNTVGAAPTSLTLPNFLHGIATFNLQGTNLVSLSIPNFISDDGSYGNGYFSQPDTVHIEYHPSFTTVNIGSIGTVKQVRDLIFFQTHLNLASIQYLVDLLISLDGTNGTTLWGTGRTLNIGGPANSTTIDAPTLAKIATLQARGATVIHN